MRLVEFGSGQSTLWYAKRCKEIISLETTDIWFQKVTKNLLKENCTNAKLLRWDNKKISAKLKNTPARFNNYRWIAKRYLCRIRN